MAGHHVVPFKTNLMTFIALVALTIITVLTAKFVNLGDWNLALAMVIATIKVICVLLWFMHLKYDGMVNRVIFISSFFFLALFFTMSFFDLYYR
ncbi:MAG: cytochrome C oxidase subunit IV family protein [Bacteriovoracaceae bacterium]|jgi:cytochrome c oxidase subunit 4|nr:cytochrome C oxidase subunit IV family protein [Bacteriovoracaceae bacterium]